MTYKYKVGDKPFRVHQVTKGYYIPQATEVMEIGSNRTYRCLGDAHFVDESCLYEDDQVLRVVEFLNS